MIRTAGVLFEREIVTAKATPAAPTSASVGVASAQIVAANVSRAGLQLINLSANTISFGINTPAVLNQGISLTQNGVWEMDPYTFTTLAIHAIASVAASALAIQEWTYDGSADANQ